MLNNADTARRDALIKKEGYKLPNGDRIVIKDGQITWMKACGFLTVERPAYGAEQVLWDLLRATLGNVAPDEPVFVLKGRDPQAPELLHMWATARARAAARMTDSDEALHQREKASTAYGLSTAMMIFKKCNPEVGLPAELVKVDQIEASHRVAEMLGLMHYHGFITRVDLLHKRPLAMGNYEMAVEIRPVLQSNS